MKIHFIKKSDALLIIVDVQEKLFPHIDHACDILEKILILAKGFQILQIPILLTEQYPKGLGHTISPLKTVLDSIEPYAKTTFSAAHDETIRQEILNCGRNQIILVGLEAHICILQTAKDLLAMGKEVIIVNDAISSRSIYDFSTAIAELRDYGARITSTETLLFELLRDAKTPEFKEITALIS